MELTDILSVEAWAQFEKELSERFHLNCTVYKSDGISITGKQNFCNKLCPEIKATDKGQAFICAVAHMNLANQARDECRPVIEECDAGFGKLVVPIFVDGEFLGAVSACGLLLDGGELLLQLGCEIAQGYAIARPMPADDFREWTKSWQPDPAWRWIGL